MKISDEHLAAMRESVKPFMRPLAVGERYRWDALWVSGFDVTPLYNYLNDSCIDTALRQLESEVRVEWMDIKRSN